VLLEELDGEDVVVRVQATPERAVDGAKLADQIIDTLSSVTGEHELVRDSAHADGDGWRSREERDTERGVSAPPTH
jgi:hypothetical protein